MAGNSISSLSAETARRDRIQSEPGARKSGDSAPAGKPGTFAGLMQQAQAAQTTPPADSARPAVNARHGVNPAKSNAADASSTDAAMGTDEQSSEPTADERTAVQRRVQAPGARSNAASPGTDEADAANPPEKTAAARRTPADGTETGASLPPWLQQLSALRAKTAAAPTAGAETAGRGAAVEGGRGSARDAAAGLGAADKAAGVVADPATQDASALTAGMTPAEATLGGAAAGNDFASTLQSMTAGPAANPTNAAPVATAPVDVPIPVPVHDPDFGAHVMMRAGDLAQAGVTEAQLHLNPSDMGPIRIHIAMDGQKAQINFEASHAETRALLEAALPALAQSLQDDGLQLARSSVVQVADLPAEPPTLGAGSQGFGRQQGGQDSSQPWRGAPGTTAVAAQRGAREGRDALAPLPRAGWGPAAPGMGARGLDLYA